MYVSNVYLCLLGLWKIKSNLVFIVLLPGILSIPAGMRKKWFTDVYAEHRCDLYIFPVLDRHYNIINFHLKKLKKKSIKEFV